ncbi:hypothetical protein FHS96_003581 [Sphingomonas zeicaulis]
MTTMTKPVAGISGMIGRKRLAHPRPTATPGTGEHVVAAVGGHHLSLTPSGAGSGTFRCNLCHLRAPLAPPASGRGTGQQSSVVSRSQLVRWRT